MAEEFAFDQIFGECGAVHTDEGVVFAGAVEVDGAGDELFTRAGLPTHENGGGAIGDLNDLLVDHAHGVAVADHVVDAVAVAELPAEHFVFGFEGVSFFDLFADGGDGRSENLGDVFEEESVGFERGFVGGGDIDTDGADHLFVVNDGYADERNFFIVAGFCAVEEFGGLADIGDDFHLAGFGNFTGDALAELIFAALHLAFGEAAGGFDVEHFGALFAQRKGAAEYTEFRLHDLEDFVEQLRDIVLARGYRLRDAIEKL